MTSYHLEQLIKLWEQEKLTTEQAIGKILLQLKALSERTGVLEKKQVQTRPDKRLSQPSK